MLSSLVDPSKKKFRSFASTKKENGKWSVLILTMKDLNDHFQLNLSKTFKRLDLNSLTEFPTKNKTIKFTYFSYFT